MNILKKIFSVTNQESKNNKWHKVIYICGLKFSLRNKRKEKRVAIGQEKQFIRDSLNNLSKQNKELQKQNDELKEKIATQNNELKNEIKVQQETFKQQNEELKNELKVQQEIFQQQNEELKNELKVQQETFKQQNDELKNALKVQQEDTRKQISEFQKQNEKLKKEIKIQNNEIIYANVLKDCTSEAKWLKKKDFSLTLGAANYSFIFILFKILDNINPNFILEFGLGQTTKLTTQYVINKNQFALLDVVEHNKEWINTFSKNIDLTDNIKIHHKNLVDFELNNVKSDKYDSLTDIVDNNQYDLIIIDGPFGYDRIYPRTNILDLIPNNLAKDFVIVLDDAERQGEKNTANLIFELLKINNIEYKTSYKVGTKTQLIITSKNYEFIHWY